MSESHDLRARLEVMGTGHYLAAFIAREGVAFRSASLTDDERAVVKAAIGPKRFLFGSCYANAQAVLKNDADGRLVYVEGFAVASHRDFPFLHAWLVISGKVIDPTTSPGAEEIMRAHAGKSRAASRNTLGRFAGGRQYVGVPFDRSYVQGAIEERKVAAIGIGGTSYSVAMLDNWQEHYPVVSGKAKGWRHEGGDTVSKGG